MVAILGFEDPEAASVDAHLLDWVSCLLCGACDVDLDAAEMVAREAEPLGVRRRAWRAH